jgi:hypothetical protein
MYTATSDVMLAIERPMDLEMYDLSPIVPEILANTSMLEPLVAPDWSS